MSKRNATIITFPAMVHRRAEEISDEIEERDLNLPPAPKRGDTKPITRK